MHRDYARQGTYLPKGPRITCKHATANSHLPDLLQTESMRNSVTIPGLFQALNIELPHSLVAARRLAIVWHLAVLFECRSDRKTLEKRDPTKVIANIASGIPNDINDMRNILNPWAQTILATKIGDASPLLATPKKPDGVARKAWSRQIPVRPQTIESIPIGAVLRLLLRGQIQWGALWFTPQELALVDKRIRKTAWQLFGHASVTHTECRFCVCMDKGQWAEALRLSTGVDAPIMLVGLSILYLLAARSDLLYEVTMSTSDQTAYSRSLRLRDLFARR